MTICAGCQTDRQEVKRDLPIASDVVLDPVSLPPKRVGQDARVALEVARSVAREANARLKRSRIIYDGVRQKYEAGS